MPPRGLLMKSKSHEQSSRGKLGKRIAFRSSGWAGFDKSRNIRQTLETYGGNKNGPHDSLNGNSDWNSRNGLYGLLRVRFI